ncbi:MAG TPA: isochorismatase family protein [Stellaceae bacterium]|nr:isochorismatase family protein [Stellaceae bacterium]
MKKWMELIPESERRIMSKAGFLDDMTIGARTALIVVDVTMGFCGSEGLTLDEAIQQYSTACGPMSWETMPRIAKLIDLFRHHKRPIIYSLSDIEGTMFAGKATKSKQGGRPKPGYNDFPAIIEPQGGDWVLAKTKASGFFQTPLVPYLTRQSIDTVVVCGVSTSGCVRATSVDAHSHGYTTIVVDDCCFDRSYFAHCANLFDLQAKYATVVSLDEISARLKGPALAAE